MGLTLLAMHDLASNMACHDHKLLVRRMMTDSWSSAVAQF